MARRMIRRNEVNLHFGNLCDIRYKYGDKRSDEIMLLFGTTNSIGGSVVAPSCCVVPTT